MKDTNNDANFIQLIQTNSELVVRFNTTIQRSKFLSTALFLAVFGFFTFFFLSLIDYLLDHLTPTGGFITQYNFQNQPTKATLLDVLVSLFALLFVLLLFVFLFKKVVFLVDEQNFYIIQELLGFGIHKKSIPKQEIEDVSLLYEENNNGEFAYITLKTKNTIIKKQIFDSENKILEEQKSQLNHAIAIIKEKIFDHNNNL